MKTGSVYGNEFHGNIELENYIGYLEHNEDSSITFPEGQLPIIKTHEENIPNSPAIYVIRDGRAATVSLWEFYGREIVIYFRYYRRQSHRFGKWSDHINSWDPISRPNTLLLKYEDILTNLDSVLFKLGVFLNQDILNHKLPPRETIADGRWVRKKTNWESELSGENLDRFNELNKTFLKQFGYL